VQTTTPRRRVDTSRDYAPPCRARRCSQGEIGAVAALEPTRHGYEPEKDAYNKHREGSEEEPEERANKKV
jgi:hypothetical protein